MTVVSTALALQGTQPSWAAAAAPGDGTIPTPGTRPNIILITTDQERYPRHWPENWVLDNLPAHKRLMANGLTFRRFFVTRPCVRPAAPLSSPGCIQANS